MGFFSDIGHELFGGGKTKIKTKQAPSPRTPDQERSWNDFMDSIYGAFDPKYYLKNNSDVLAYYNNRVRKKNEPVATVDNLTPGARKFANQHWEEYGKAEGRQSNDTNYKNRLAEDIAYQKAADTGYVSDVGNLRDTFLQQLAGTTTDKNIANTAYGNQEQGITDTYTNQLAKNLAEYMPEAQKSAIGLQELANASYEPATSAPITVSLGDFSTPFTTGTQQAAKNQYGKTQEQLTDLYNQIFSNRNATGTEIYGANTTQANLLNTLANQNATNTEGLNQRQLEQLGAQAQMENQLANRFTPNQAANDYQKWLQDFVMQQEALRYGIPTTTEQENIPTDYLGGIGKTATALAALL